MTIVIILGLTGIVTDPIEAKRVEHNIKSVSWHRPRPAKTLNMVLSCPSRVVYGIAVPLCKALITFPPLATATFSGPLHPEFWPITDSLAHLQNHDKKIFTGFRQKLVGTWLYIYRSLEIHCLFCFLVSKRKTMS
jgi:hypothetical protein